MLRGMTTTPLRAEHSNTDAVIAENVNTLIHRARETASELARAIGMSKATLSRKMSGASGWYYVEVEAVAGHYDVTPAELAGVLPSLEEWYAIRDSNPEPADMSSRPVLTLILGVNRGLTTNRIQAGEWPDDMPGGLPAPQTGQTGRRLSAVS
jgi:hypothetical protein